LDHGLYLLEQPETEEITNWKNNQIAAKNVVKFKAGAELEGAVN
jgi:nucleoid DNA-binding protein